MNPSDPQADALARWLEAHPGADPPDGLDPDVVEAVYMLRPDLAPAPSVSADDIWASMGASPVGEAAPDDVVTVEPAPVVVPQMPSSVAEAPATPRPANRRALWAAIGSVAAVAAAVLVVSTVALNSQSLMPNDAMAPVASAPRAPAEVPEQAVAEREESGRVAGNLQPAREPASAAVQRAEDTLTVVTGEAERSGDDAFDAVADLGLRDDNDFEQIAQGGSGGVSSRGSAEGLDQSVADGVLGGVTGGELAADTRTGAPRDVPVIIEAAEEQTLDAVADLDNDDRMEDDVGEVGSFGQAFEYQLQDEVDSLDEGGDFLDDEVASGPAGLSVTRTAATEELAPAAPPVEVEAVASARPVRNRRPRGSRQQSAAPEADAPPPPPAAPAQATASSAPSEPVGLDAVTQARGRAAQLAAVQQFGQAFDALAPFVSPSAPTVLIIEAAEYAFAAGRWEDVIAVTTPRLNSPQSGDSAQQRARLFDLQARAQAMATPDPAMRMDQLMEAEPQ